MNLVPTDADVLVAPGEDSRVTAFEGVAADAWRALRTSLLHATAGKTLRSVLVTSADAGEGKSLTSSQVARSIAALGRRVLVVDADLRAPTQHDHFGMPMTEFGLGTVSLADPAALDHCRIAVEDRIDLLPAGRPILGSSERLSLQALHQQLRWLAETYDFMVVDTPPVGRVPDAAIIAGLVDGVLFVADARRQDTALSRRALRALRQVDANVLGAVLNRSVPDAAAARGYGYGHRAG